MPASFAVVLRRFRLRADLSQGRLAALAGYSAGFVCRLEDGGRAPSSVSIARLADALELCGDDRDRLFAAAGLWPEDWDAEDIIGLLAWRGKRG